MTALNWALREDALYLTADTVVLYGDKRRPRNFMTKIYPVPHLDGVITGTGIGGFIAEWFVAAQTEFLVRDLHHLDQYAPEALRTLADDHPHTDDLTSTVYHFGLSCTENQFVGFAYRSANNFASERLRYGDGYMPRLELDPPDEMEFPAWFIEVMKRQREEDFARPRDERVGVGGEVQALQMVKSGIQVWTCHRFDDYEDTYHEMDGQLP